MKLGLFTRHKFVNPRQPWFSYGSTKLRGFPGGSASKESACNAGDQGSIPGSRRPPGEGNVNSLQYSCLGNYMDRGPWWAINCGVARVGRDLVTKWPTTTYRADLVSLPLLQPAKDSSFSGVLGNLIFSLISSHFISSLRKNAKKEFPAPIPSLQIHKQFKGIVSCLLRALTDRRNRVHQTFMYISGGDHPIGAYPMDCDSNGGKKWKLSTLSIPGSWKNLCFNQSLLLFQNTWGLSKMFFSYTLKEMWQLTAVNQFQPNYKSNAWQRKPKCLKAASASLPC